MPVRHGVWRGMPSSAAFSDDGLHRFWLTRRWANGAGVCFVMLNPSRATESGTDNTVSFCVGRARDWGYGQVAVVNLFTFMSPHPDRLAGHPGRDDAGGDATILQFARQADLRIAAWGGDRRFRDRGARVAAMLAGAGLDLHCLGRTADGAPRHPRAMPRNVRPQPWP